MHLRLQLFELDQHGVGVVVARHGFAVGPLFGEAPFNAAMRRAAGRALHLLVQRRAAEKRAGVARGIAQQHPADRLGLRAEFAQVHLHLPAMVPAVVPEVVPLVLIHLEDFGGDLHHTFEHVQLRAYGECFKQRGAAPHLARQQGVALAGGVACAHQHAPSLHRPQRRHKLAAQRAERRRVYQHHALVGQPDTAIAGGKVHQAAQIPVGRQGRERGIHGKNIDKTEALAIQYFVDLQPNFTI